MVHGKAFSDHEDMETPIAEPAALHRQFAQAGSQVVVTGPGAAVAYRCPIHIKGRARPPLAHLPAILWSVSGKSSRSIAPHSTWPIISCPS
jgi:hypothetical protein